MRSSSSSLGDLMLQCAQEKICILPSCAFCIILYHLWLAPASNTNFTQSRALLGEIHTFGVVDDQCQGGKEQTTSRIPKTGMNETCSVHLRASPDTCCSPFSFQARLQLECTRDVCGPTLPWCTRPNSKALAITPFDDKASVASRALDSPGI